MKDLIKYILLGIFGIILFFGVTITTVGVENMIVIIELFAITTGLCLAGGSILTIILKLEGID